MATAVASGGVKFTKKSPPTSGKGRLKVDAARVLEPARKKLTTLETQRVMAVLDEAVKRIQILSVLPSLLNNMSDFSIVLGRDLVALLEEHAEIRKQYVSVASKMDILKGRTKVQKSKSEILNEEDFWTRPKSNASGTQSTILVSETLDKLRENETALQAELQALTTHIQYSTRNILRAFRRNPAAVTAVIGGPGGGSNHERLSRCDGMRGVMKNLDELRDIMMLRLMTTPAERAEKMTYLREVSERERANAAVIEKLTEELQCALADKDVDVRKKNDVIRRLQSDIHHIEKFSEDSINRTKSEAEKQQAADIKNSDGKKQKLVQELNQFKTQLTNMVNEHRESEANLRRRKWKLETEVENWIQKYDSDMGERQTEFEEVDSVYTEERKQLVELEERFKTLEEEYNQIMEERRIAREKQEAEERELQLMVLAATTIQSFWRSYKVRKLLRGKKGKGKKGKGKKK